MARPLRGDTNKTKLELNGLPKLTHNLVEMMDRYFENVCELDIIYNIEKATTFLMK